MQSSCLLASVLNSHRKQVVELADKESAPSNLPRFRNLSKLEGS